MANLIDVQQALRLSSAQQRLIEDSIQARLDQFSRQKEREKRGKKERGRELVERSSPRRGFSAPPPKNRSRPSSRAPGDDKHKKKKKKKPHFLSMRARKERKKKKELQKRARTLSREISKSSLYQDRKSQTTFGRSLRQLMARQKLTEPKLRIPVFVKLVTEAIRKKIKTIGLFRVPAVASDVNEIRKSIDIGEDVNFDELPPHVLAGLFKLFLKKLPTPVFTYNVYDNVLYFAKHPDGNMEILLESVKCLPSAHRHMLDFLVQFLIDVADVKENRMDLNSLAIVISPNLIRPKVETEQTILEDTKVLHVIMAHLLHHKKADCGSERKEEIEESVELSRTVSEFGNGGHMTDSDYEDDLDLRPTRASSDIDLTVHLPAPLRPAFSDVGPMRSVTMRR